MLLNFLVMFGVIGVVYNPLERIFHISAAALASASTVRRVGFPRKQVAAAKQKAGQRSAQIVGCPPKPAAKKPAKA